MPQREIDLSGIVWSGGTTIGRFKCIGPSTRTEQLRGREVLLALEECHSGDAESEVLG